MKKVLILQAEKTGTGHKSAANAIEKKLNLLGYSTKQLNCFTLMGKMGVNMENCYIPLTTKHPGMWKIAHGFSQLFTNLTHWFIYQKSKKQLLKQILDYKPDLIVSVHCMFTKAVSKLLKKNNLNIPFMINVIDLVKPPKVWQDKRANMLFLPTEEVKQDYLKRGFKPEQLVVSGFPIREDIVRPTRVKLVEDKPNILMVNPSVNINKNVAFLKETAKLDANISFVCGRDERLYNRLIEEQKKDLNLKNVEIVGFVTDMNERLKNCHILLTKAGPNMLLEGTKSGSAVVVTGHIPGQEARNFEYITKNGYGFKCENPKKLYPLLKEAMDNGKINEYLQNVLNSKANDGAKIIAGEIDKFLKKQNK